jgi:hypothetical protein
MGATAGYLGAQKVGAFAGNRVNTQLQNAMLDPQLFAQMLADAARRAGQQQVPGLLGAVPKAGALGADEASAGLLGGN